MAREDIESVRTEFRGGASMALLASEKVVCLDSGAGTGKGQPLDALVMTPDGPLPMGDVKPGAMVQTPTGVSWVEKIHPLGRRAIYRVSFRTGESVETTLDHLWQVTTYKGQERLMTLEEIYRDYLYGVTERPRYRVPMSLPVWHPHRELPIAPYCLGYLLGNGNYTQTTLSISTQDEYVVERFRRALEPGARVRQQGEYGYELTYAPKWRRALRDLGLWGKYSFEKWIPASYLYAHVHARRELLRGLMDSDGTVDRNTGMAAYCTTSLQLMRDVQTLVESLGGSVSYTTKKTTHRDAYIAQIKLNDARDIFGLPRKRALARDRTKYPVARWITDIRFSRMAEAQCIEIADPAGLYLTDHYVVTHNSWVALHKCLHVFCSYPGSRQLFLRLTRISLAETVLVDWEAMLPPDLRLYQGRATRAHREGYHHPNGADVVCGGADQVDRYLSGKYDRIYIAQAEEIRDMEILYKLLSRLRNGKTPYHQLLLDVNPAEESHPINKQCDQLWCGRCQVEPTKGQRCPKCGVEVRRRIRRIPFRIEDNPRWYDQDQKGYTAEGLEYMQSLWEMDGVTRMRLLEHRWVTAEGLVWPTYDSAHHLVLGHLERGEYGWNLHMQDEAHPLYRATGGVVKLVWFFADMDVGHTAPGCMQVWGVDRDGIAIRVAEYYHTAWDDNDWAERACELFEEFRYRALVVDSAHSGTITLLNKRVARLSGMPQIVIGAAKGPGSVEASVRHVRTLFRRDERTGLASIYLFAGAARVVDRQLARRHRAVSMETELPSYVLAKPTLQTPDQEIPDRSVNTPGHACAAAMYGLTWAFPLNLAPAVKRPELPPESYGMVLFRERGGMLGILEGRYRRRRR